MSAATAELDRNHSNVDGVPKYPPDRAAPGKDRSPIDSARKKKPRAIVESYRVTVLANRIPDGIEQEITLGRRKSQMIGVSTQELAVGFG